MYVYLSLSLYIYIYMYIYIYIFRDLYCTSGLVWDPEFSVPS